MKVVRVCSEESTICFKDMCKRIILGVSSGGQQIWPRSVHLPSHERFLQRSWKVLHKTETSQSEILNGGRLYTFDESDAMLENWPCVWHPKRHGFQGRCNTGKQFIKVLQGGGARGAVVVGYLPHHLVLQEINLIVLVTFLACWIHFKQNGHVQKWWERRRGIKLINTAVVHRRIRTRFSSLNRYCMNKTRKACFPSTKK